MYIAGLEVLRLSFDDCTSPSTVTWERTNQTISSANTLDPILFTDNDTGNGENRTNRTFVSQLAAADGSSLFEFTDNDGQSYTPGAKGSGIGSGVDHQTVGGGPYARNPDGTIKGGAGPLTSYPNAVYYASQNIGYANLARSDDGGLNFGPAIPMYDLTQCGGLHGHIKVAPDGTIYVPNKGCGGNQAVAVSEDNGLNFKSAGFPAAAAAGLTRRSASALTARSISVTRTATVARASPSRATRAGRGLTTRTSAWFTTPGAAFFRQSSRATATALPSSISAAPSRAAPTPTPQATLIPRRLTTAHGSVISLRPTTAARPG
jgi:hypothetical protein